MTELKNDLKKVYEALTKANIHWDRKDKNHIIVWTPGYKSTHHANIEKFLNLAGMKLVDEKFDRQSGKTWGVYKHNPSQVVLPPVPAPNSDEYVMNPDDEQALFKAHTLVRHGAEPVDAFDVVTKSYPKAHPYLLKEMISFWVEQGVRQNPFHSPAVANIIAWLLYLKQNPTLHSNVPKKILATIENEGFFKSESEKLTAKGKKFLEQAYK